MSNNRLNSTNRYIALAVETTGFSPKNGDRVIEIGAVAIEDQSIVKDRNLKTLRVIIVFAFKAKKSIFFLNYEGKWGFRHSIFSSCERSARTFVPESISIRTKSTKSTTFPNVQDGSALEI